MAEREATLRVRLGTSDTHYRSQLIPAATVMRLFADCTTEIGIRDNGRPGLLAAYEGAEVLGVRMSTPGEYQGPDEQVTGTSPDGEAAAGEPPPPDGEEGHSARYHQHALYKLRSKEMREKAGLVW